MLCIACNIKIRSGQVRKSFLKLANMQNNRFMESCLNDVYEMKKSVSFVSSQVAAVLAC